MVLVTPVTGQQVTFDQLHQIVVAGGVGGGEVEQHHTPVAAGEFCQVCLAGPADEEEEEEEEEVEEKEEEVEGGSANKQNLKACIMSAAMR
jgi:hypothetical protein